MDKNTLDRLRQLAGTAPKTQYAADQSRMNMYQIRDNLMESSVVAEKTTKWKKAPSKNGKYYAEKDGESKGFTSDLKRDEFIRKQNNSVSESSAVDRARYDAASDDKKKVSLKPAPWEKDKKEVKEEGKPDFADLDKDGDKKEPMAKAAKDKKEMTEAERLSEGWQSISVSPDRMMSLERNYIAKGLEDYYVFYYSSPKSSNATKMEFIGNDYVDARNKFRQMVSKTGPKTETDLMREWANSVYQQYDDAGTVQEQPEGETVDLSLRRYLNATPQKVTAIAEDIQPEALLREYKDFKADKSKQAKSKASSWDDAQRANHLKSTKLKKDAKPKSASKNPAAEKKSKDKK